MTGIVVESKSSGNRYARSEANFDPNREKKVRDLKPGETILGFKPRSTRKATPAQDDPVLFNLPADAVDNKEG